MYTWKNSNSSSTNGGCEKWGRKFLKAWWFQLRNRGEKLFNINGKLQQCLHRLQNSSLCLPCSVPWASTYFQCTHITFCIQYDLPCVPTSIKVRTYWQRTRSFVEGKIRERVCSEIWGPYVRCKLPPHIEPQIPRTALFEDLTQCWKLVEILLSVRRSSFAHEKIFYQFFSVPFKANYHP